MASSAEIAHVSVCREQAVRVVDAHRKCVLTGECTRCPGDGWPCLSVREAVRLVQRCDLRIEIINGELNNYLAQAVPREVLAAA